MASCLLRRRFDSTPIRRVLDHPFFDVTGETGRFSITGLPPGTSVIEIWHERLGTQTQEVDVSADEAKDVTFTYTRS